MPQFILEIEGAEAPIADLDDSDGVEYYFEFTWRGVFNLIFRSRVMTIRVYKLMPIEEANNDISTNTNEA